MLMLLNNYPEDLRLMENSKRFVHYIILLCLLLLVIVTVAMISGPAGMVFCIDDITQNIILFQVRMPRIFLSIIVGFALGCGGVVFQSLLQNPLAEPYVLGTSAGAAAMAALGMVLGVSAGFFILWFGFAGALISILFVLGVARIGGRYPLYRLIVSGIIVHSFFSAILMLLITGFSSKTSGVMLWLMGNLANKPLSLVLVLGAIVLICFVIIQVKWKELNLLALGDDHALACGVNVVGNKIVFLTLTTIMTGGVVAVSGVIGFVGIIVPHIIRLLVGANHKYLLLSASLGGALFLLVADTIIRLFFDGIDLPVGVITALAGAPFFIYLLFRQGKKL